jgi:hypothetical protein
VFTEQENAMKSSWIRIGLPSLLVLFLASSLAQAQQMYLMTRLGFSPTSPTINGANGINNNGDVVGYDSAINGAYLLHNGVLSSLGMTSASGVAISITGQVARICTPICSRRGAGSGLIHSPILGHWAELAASITPGKRLRWG